MYQIENTTTIDPPYRLHSKPTMTPNEADPLLPTKAANPSAKDNNNNQADEFPPLWHVLRHGVVLANVGSTARDHLANERTYLAWIRTALALTGVGIGLLKWEGVGNVAGYIVLAGGFFVLLNSSFRYIHVMQNLSKSQFEPNVRSLLTMVVVILGLIVSLIFLTANGDV